MTPTGSRRTYEVWSPEYSPAARPCGWRAAPAKKAALSTVPGTSNSRVSLSGLPHCRDSTRASSSARSARTAAKRCSASARSPGVAPAHPGRAARAAATARSTSAGPASAKRWISWPVAGSTTACSRPEVPCAGAPARYCAPPEKRSRTSRRARARRPPERSSGRSSGLRSGRCSGWCSGRCSGWCSGRCSGSFSGWCMPLSSESPRRNRRGRISIWVPILAERMDLNK